MTYKHISRVFSFVIFILIECSAHAAARDIVSAQKQIQQMSNRLHTALSSAQLAQLKEALRQPDLLNAAHLEPATINALGNLLLLASADHPLQDDAMDQLLRRIGIDVDAQGFVSLFDRIRVSRGEEPVFGTTPRTSSSPLTANQIRDINRARRSQGLMRVEGDASNAAPFSDQSLPLAMRKPVYPTLPEVRVELLKLMVLDQNARRPALPNASKKEKQAIRRHMDEVDSQMRVSFLPIFKKYGFPNNAMVGRYGTVAAWVLIQHAIGMPQLMIDAAKQAKTLHDRGELADSYYALLVDRVACLIEHKPQTFGTIPHYSNPKDPFYCPIESLEGVNGRRAEVFLPPIAIPSN